VRPWLLPVLVALWVSPSAVSARADGELPYPPAQVWNAAVRLIRVDLGFEVTERDEAAGFLLFTYADNGRTSPGSMEMVRVGGEARPTKVIFALRDMPRYHELNLLDRLSRKLREDYGDPPRPRPPARAPDAGPPTKRADAGPSR
jgi:hypothetical protein